MLEENYADNHADADVEDDAPVTSPSALSKGESRLRPRHSKGRKVRHLEDDDDGDDSSSVVPTRPAVQRRNRSAASKRSSGGGGNRRSSDIAFSTIHAALERTLKTQEWDDTLLLLGTKELNSSLKQANYSKEQVAALKVARRRAKNRTYALRSRQKKSGKILSPCPGTDADGAQPTESAMEPSSTVLSTSPSSHAPSMTGVPAFGVCADPDLAATPPPPPDDLDENFSFGDLARPQNSPSMNQEENVRSHSSDHWDTTSSYSEDLLDGFTSSTSYDSFSSSHSSTAFASTFESFGALSLEPTTDFPATPSDNFLNCIFANIPEDSTGQQSAHAADINPEAGSMSNGVGESTSTSELDAMMLELSSITSSYGKVHEKLDTLAGAIPELTRDRMSTVTDDSKQTSGGGTAAAAAAAAAAAVAHGRTTPTPALESEFGEFSQKLDSWTSQFELPTSPEGNALSPSTFFDSTNTPVLSGMFTFDGAAAEAEVAAARTKSE